MSSADDKRARLRDELEFYSRNCLVIRTKTGEVEPFLFNRAQQHIHAKLEE